eukprot:TRINITY_DN1659_c0_g1_i1.p1 TRINITY_DN1659_c0_g1~~TRINITY_DN1659_c0_g1_i1.p1  ORF type:complete len:211 (-),score=41.86 TRINITY_DN1659_c0_g1_i1:46-678(-)
MKFQGILVHFLLFCFVALSQQQKRVEFSTEIFYGASINLTAPTGSCRILEFSAPPNVNTLVLNLVTYTGAGAFIYNENFTHPDTLQSYMPPKVCAQGKNVTDFVISPLLPRSGSNTRGLTTTLNKQPISCFTNDTRRYILLYSVPVAGTYPDWTFELYFDLRFANYSTGEKAPPACRNFGQPAVYSLALSLPLFSLATSICFVFLALLLF